VVNCYMSLLHKHICQDQCAQMVPSYIDSGLDRVLTQPVQY
jgi:hypothetical protein